MHLLEQLLLDALNGAVPLEAERLAALAPEQWRALMELAAAQRVRPLLRHRFGEKGVAHLLPAEAAAALREASRETAMQNMRRYGELRILLTALQGESIPVILLKGIYLADVIYGNMGLREMNDIDLLARPGDLARIAAILTRMGYDSPLHVSPEVTFKVCHHLPPIAKRGHASFEIHWNLMGPGEVGYAAPDGFRERAVPVRAGGCDALALTPEDLLLHLCHHTSFHHEFAFGLRPSCDIAAVIARFGAGLDWHTFVERAGQLGWKRGAYLALRMARDLVGGETPAAVLERLRPADITEEITETVRSQIFSDKEVVATIESLAEFLQTRSLFRRCRIFWQRLFVPKARIAFSYSVPVDSIRIYGCYARRVFDLLRNHGPKLKKFRKGDRKVREIVQRKNLIIDWLSSGN